MVNEKDSFYQKLNRNELSIIAGPCVLEHEDHALFMSEKIKEVCDKHDVNFIYKTSFDKANRSSYKSFRGCEIEDAGEIFVKIKEEVGCEIITDIHESWQANFVDGIDIIQIPAFLSRQTDLLCAAANTHLPVNVKKGQFLAPEEVKNIIDKLENFGAEEIMITERGNTFGYNNLIVDFRNFEIMSKYGYPIVFDATHSVQKPGGLGESSGGNREFAEPLAIAAATQPISAVFAEVHDDPDNAPSDGPNMIPLDKFDDFVYKLKIIFEIKKELNNVENDI